MKALFIINPAAGGRNRVREVNSAVVAAFKGADGLFEIKAASKKGDGARLAAGAVEKGYELVFACGGDGTLHEVATPLVNTNTALGIIPCGSGNGFARSLGIPQEIAACVELVRKGRLRPVDVGVIGDRFFFGTAGLGFDAHLSRKYNDGFLSKRLRGLLPYFPLAMWEFYRYRPRPLLMKMDNSQTSETPFILTFANTERYGGEAIIAPGACPDDGLLDVCTVPEIGLFGALGLAGRLFKGTINTFKGYRCTRAGTIEILRESSLSAHADGEPFEWRGDMVIKTLHKSLNVLVA